MKITNEFIHHFSKVISRLKNNHKHNIIREGDFNIHMLEINEQENCIRCFMLTFIQALSSNNVTYKVL